MKKKAKKIWFFQKKVVPLWRDNI